MQDPNIAAQMQAIMLQKQAQEAMTYQAMLEKQAKVAQYNELEKQAQAALEYHKEMQKQAEAVLTQIEMEKKAQDLDSNVLEQMPWYADPAVQGLIGGGSLGALGGGALGGLGMLPGGIGALGGAGLGALGGGALGGGAGLLTPDAIALQNALAAKMITPEQHAEILKKFPELAQQA